MRPRPRRALVHVFAALALAVLLGACHGRWWHDDDNERELVGRRWVLQVLTRDDGGVTSVPRGDAFTVEFEADGDLSVKADCNQCGGTYEAGEARLRVSPLACTRVFCTETAPFDTEFVEQLQASHSYFVERRLLTIRTDDGVLVFDR